MIHVIDKWVIDSDGKTYTGGKLATRTLKDGTKEEYIKDAFYHSTLAGCMQAISRRMRADTIKNMDGNIEAAIEAVQAAIEAVQAADKRLMDAVGVFDGIEIVQKSGRREQ